ncbi:hypothetical protein SLEP1_g46459 [Rubroshorea leprosula]|uniref:Uncharacterized protein n=1 Tax=Rubroshorea leprosula TaxID=152421 RepID=A0AAV5LMB3_9ROSI|nr:hypothetical protein SLEP1_g46459 [Rubroshorea leprosula]
MDAEENDERHWMENWDQKHGMAVAQVSLGLKKFWLNK